MASSFIAWATFCAPLDVHGAAMAGSEVNRIVQLAAAKADQTITFVAPAAKTYGDAPFTLAATASSLLPVTFRSVTTSICSTSGTNGSTVTLVGVGTCTIRASQAGNAVYNAAPDVNRSIVVNPATQVITFGTLKDRVYGSGSFTVSAVASSGLPVSFASTSPGVCTVGGSTVKLIAGGRCTIRATQAGNAIYAAATAVERSFNVTQASQTITFGTLSGRTATAAPFAVSATASSGLTVTFASQTIAVCTVSGNVVTLVGAGTCTIRASQAGNASYAAATDVNRSFAVTLASQSISFGSLSSKSYGSAPFTVSATASSGLTVSFASTTAAVCSVSGNTVTVVAVGTCTVRATQAGSAIYAAASAVNQSFSVTPASQSISFAAVGDQPIAAAAVPLTATASSGLPVTLSTLTSSVCTVASDVATLIARGTCSIRASQPGDANYAAAIDVTQSFTVNGASQTIAFGVLRNRAVGASSFALDATASSGLPVSFASLTSGTCTVGGSAVTLVASGTCTIRASQAGNAAYATAAPIDRGFLIFSAGTVQYTYDGAGNVVGIQRLP